MLATEIRNIEKRFQAGNQMAESKCDVSSTCTQNNLDRILHVSKDAICTTKSYEKNHNPTPRAPNLCTSSQRTTSAEMGKDRDECEKPRWQSREYHKLQQGLGKMSSPMYNLKKIRLTSDPVRVFEHDASSKGARSIGEILGIERLMTGLRAIRPAMPTTARLYQDLT
jgi:hypothetical protein